MTSSAAVALRAALAAVAVNRQPDDVALETIGVRRAVDEERPNREDRRAGHIDEQGVEFQMSIGAEREAAGPCAPWRDCGG